MSGARLHWTLVFTPASLEHLSERNVGMDDVAAAVFGRHGPARVRRAGRRPRERWYVIAPMAGGELLTSVLRRVDRRDLQAEDALVVPRTGPPGIPTHVTDAMRLCVSARMSDADEIRSYRTWRRSKGG